MDATANVDAGASIDEMVGMVDLDAQGDSPSLDDATTTDGGDAGPGDDETDPCAPGAPYGLGRCNYSVDLPCGATYASEQCHLLLTDCMSVCSNGFVTCQYAAAACDDSGTVTVAPPSPVTVLCNSSTSKLCIP